MLLFEIQLRSKLFLLILKIQNIVMTHTLKVYLIQWFEFSTVLAIRNITIPLVSYYRNFNISNGQHCNYINCVMTESLKKSRYFLKSLQENKKLKSVLNSRLCSFFSDNISKLMLKHSYLIFEITLTFKMTQYFFSMIQINFPRTYDL